MNTPSNPTFSESVEIFGRHELADLFRDKILELSAPEPRFTGAQRNYLAFRCGSKDAAWMISLGEALKKSRRKTGLAHWARLYLRVTDRPPIDHPSRLTDDQIEQVRRYPTDQLFEGRLYRTGKTFKAKCPFHEERTPSFYFYTDGSYHCFGCGAHGANAIDYVMAFEKLSFLDAVRRLL